MNAEIRYAEEPITPCGPVRSLFAAGEWLVPESERPANWRERMEPKEGFSAKTAEYINRMEQRRAGMVEHHPPSQITRAPHAPGAGRPRGFAKGHAKVGGAKKGARLGITAEALAERMKTETLAAIAKDLGCHFTSLSKFLSRSGVAIVKLCADCGEPTKRAANSIRCWPCAVKYTGNLHNESRKEKRAAKPRKKRAFADPVTSKEKRRASWRAYANRKRTAILEAQ